jgi:hypothetical protein
MDLDEYSGFSDANGAGENQYRKFGIAGHRLLHIDKSRPTRRR